MSETDFDEDDEDGIVGALLDEDEDIE